MIHRGDTATLQLLNQLLDDAPLGILLVDSEGNVATINRHASDILQVSERAAQGRPLVRVFPEFESPESERVRFAPALADETGWETFTCEKTSADGASFYQVTVVPQEGEEGRLVLIQNVTRLAWSKLLEQGLSRALERLARGGSLEEVLVTIVEGAERSRPRMLCSVLLLDEDGRHLRHGAAPSLPEFYTKAIDGLEIGPHAGSCGTAAFTGKRVIVTDVMADPNWEPYRDLARRAQIRACWSQPILSSDQRVLGTFAMYYRDVREPEAKDLELIDSTSHICGIAIERKRAEEALRSARDALEFRVEERTRELAKANETLREEIAQRNQAEEALKKKSHLLQTLIDILPVRIFAKDTRSQFILNNREHLRLLGVTTPEEALHKTTFQFFPDDRGANALADDQQVLKSGEPLLDRERYDKDPGGANRWVLTTKVPLRDDAGKVMGIAGISYDITERKLEEQKLERLTEQLRTRNQEMETDLKMAREIQLACLPHHYPEFPPDAASGESALRFYHRYHPTATLAGDFFDILAISDNLAGVLICDVMGHGVRASLVTALLRGLVEKAIALADDPAAFLMEINRGLISILRQAGSPMFVTAFYLVVDALTGRIRYANAGHPCPLLVCRDAGVVNILRPEDQRPEPGLGFVDGFQFSNWEASLSRRDMVVLFTDGLYEVNPALDRFGPDELREAVRQRAHLSPEKLFDDLFEEIHRFSGAKDFSDDVCLVAIELAR